MSGFDVSIDEHGTQTNVHCTQFNNIERDYRHFQTDADGLPEFVCLKWQYFLHGCPAPLRYVRHHVKVFLSLEQATELRDELNAMLGDC